MSDPWLRSLLEKSAGRNAVWAIKKVMVCWNGLPVRGSVLKIDMPASLHSSWRLSFAQWLVRSRRWRLPSSDPIMSRSK